MKIPRPTLPEGEYDPSSARVRLDFTYIRNSGDYSRKAFVREPKGKQRKFCKAFIERSRLPLLTFKSSNGVRLSNCTTRFRPPAALSQDVKDQMWQHFRVSGKMRVFGFLLDRTFYVVLVDLEHKIHP